MTRRLGLLLAIAAAAAILSFRPIYEPDLWWHLAQGREDAAGRLVRTNVFSAVYHDYRQHYTPWLFDTVAYLAWQTLGPVGIQLLQAALLGLTLLLLFIACRARAPAWSAAAVLMLGFFILEPRAIPRPHLVSFAAMAGCTLLIERACARRSARPLWAAVPLIAVWSNFHVECVFGVLLIAVFAASELAAPAALSRQDARGALIVAAGCGLATMANPYGWGLAGYLYENLSVPGFLAIAELRPPSLPAYRAFYAYLVIMAVCVALLPRLLALREAVVAVTFAILGVMHLRETPLVLLVTAPILAHRLAALTTRGLDYRAILITAACASIALSRIPIRLLLAGFDVGRAAVEPREFFSPDAAAFVRRTGLEGAVFNSHNLGGYLAWTLHPQVRVFQDSRLQAYPPQHFRGIIAASATQAEWDLLVAGVDWAVISIRRPNQLAGTGRFPPAQWGSVYLDEALEIVVRRRGRFSRLLAEGRERVPPPAAGVRPPEAEPR